MDDVQRIKEITNEHAHDAARAARGQAGSFRDPYFQGPHMVELGYGVTRLLGEIAGQLAVANGLKRMEMGVVEEPVGEEDDLIPTAPTVDWTLANNVSDAGEKLLNALKRMEGVSDGVNEAAKALRKAIDDYTDIPF